MVAPYQNLVGDEMAKAVKRQLAEYAPHIIQNIHALRGREVIIVGDVGLDEYVLGDVRRISPEAPVPVLRVKLQQDRIGGEAGRERAVGQALAVAVDGHAADVVRAERERLARVLGDVLQNANGFGRDFRTNAVAGQQRDLQ
jgi:hypothetical protein